MTKMNALVAVGVFVSRSHQDRRCVVGRRKAALGEGTWSLPGGHLEEGESFEDCARREVLEEAGLNITDVRFLTAVETCFADERLRYIAVFMTAVVEDVDGCGCIPEPRVMEPDKCESWSWWSVKEVRPLGEKDPARLFRPIVDLMKQRREVLQALERGDCV